MSLCLHDAATIKQLVGLGKHTEARFYRDGVLAPGLEEAQLRLDKTLFHDQRGFLKWIMISNESYAKRLTG